MRSEETLLHAVCGKGFRQMVKQILEEPSQTHGNVNSWYKWLCPPLHFAAELGDTVTAQMLLDAGVYLAAIWQPMELQGCEAAVRS